MADTTFDSLRRMSLSATDMRQLSDWNTKIIEEFLNLINNIVLIANDIDTEVTVSTALLQDVESLRSFISKNRVSNNASNKRIDDIDTLIETIDTELSKLMQQIEIPMALINRNKGKIAKDHKLLKNLEQLAYVR